MDTNQLKEIVRLHGLWLAGSGGGIRADLSHADLSHADLINADLRYADLSDANLSNADLSNANLSNADLSNANLSHADLRCTIGDGSIIRTIQTGVYVVVIWGPKVSIGCQSHNWTEWMEFNDTSIDSMGGQKAVDFWRIWKPILTAIMKVR
jgi:hypothetical protein